MEKAEATTCPEGHKQAGAQRAQHVPPARCDAIHMQAVPKLQRFGGLNGNLYLSEHSNQISRTSASQGQERHFLPRV